MFDVSAIAPEKPRPLRRAEYDRLVEAGAFDDERIELLEGVLVEMTPQRPAHASAVRRLTRILIRAVDDTVEVQVQSPLAISDLSEPEPDLAVVPRGSYGAEHPRTALLVVEVADSSLAKDRDFKASLYASAGVPEYWIVNVRDSVVEVHRAPTDGTYADVQVARRGDVLRPTPLVGVTVAVDDVLG